MEPQILPDLGGWQTETTCAQAGGGGSVTGIPARGGSMCTVTASLQWLNCPVSVTDWKTGRQVDHEPESTSGTAQATWPIHHWELAGPMSSPSASGDKTARGALRARCYLLPFASKIHHFLAWIDGGGIKGWYNGVALLIPFWPPFKAASRGKFPKG